MWGRRKRVTSTDVAVIPSGAVAAQSTTLARPSPSTVLAMVRAAQVPEQWWRNGPGWANFSIYAEPIGRRGWTWQARVNNDPLAYDVELFASSDLAIAAAQSWVAELLRALNAPSDLVGQWGGAHSVMAVPPPRVSLPADRALSGMRQLGGGS